MDRDWDTTSIKKMQGLHPHLIKGLNRAIQLTPFPFRVICGVRTLAEQRVLLAQGATTTLKSRHIPKVPKEGGLAVSHAFDAIPLFDVDNDGKIENSEFWHWPLYHKMAPFIKQAFKEVGVPIEWGGDWRSFKDGPHWQLPWKLYP